METLKLVVDSHQLVTDVATVVDFLERKKHGFDLTLAIDQHAAFGGTGFVGHGINGSEFSSIEPWSPDCRFHCHLAGSQRVGKEAISGSGGGAPGSAGAAQGRRGGGRGRR
ncbi:hypothetical protein LBMAG41_15030 [Cyanobium sp.]|nr:hypothetical protein LBMAG41_15030 [Cyanobium sp.]